MSETQMKVAKENITRLVDDLKEKKMLPAICFNDDRFICEELARTLGIFLTYWLTFHELSIAKS